MRLKEIFLEVVCGASKSSAAFLYTGMGDVHVGARLLGTQ